MSQVRILPGSPRQPAENPWFIGVSDTITRLGSVLSLRTKKNETGFVGPLWDQKSHKDSHKESGGRAAPAPTFSPPGGDLDQRSAGGADHHHRGDAMNVAKRHADAARATAVIAGMPERWPRAFIAYERRRPAAQARASIATISPDATSANAGAGTAPIGTTTIAGMFIGTTAGGVTVGGAEHTSDDTISRRSKPTTNENGPDLRQGRSEFRLRNQTRTAKCVNRETQERTPQCRLHMN
jgi:hypothetical protein